MASIRKRNPQGKGKIRVKLSKSKVELYGKQIAELPVCADLKDPNPINEYIKLDIFTDLLNPSNFTKFFKTEWSAQPNMN